MTLKTLIRLSGWGMVIGALALLATFLPDEARPTTLTTLPFLLAIVLTSLGMLGLRARYGVAAGQAASTLLGIGVLGGVASVIGNVLWAVGYDGGRSLMNMSMAFMFAGLFLFGMVALQKRPMTRGNGLPVLAGLWWPTILVASYAYPRLTGLRLDVPSSVSFALFLGMAFSLALLGYRMQAEA